MSGSPPPAPTSEADFSLTKIALGGVPRGSEAFQRGYAKAASRVLGDAFKGLDLSQILTGDIPANVRDLKYSPAKPSPVGREATEARAAAALSTTQSRASHLSLLPPAATSAIVGSRSPRPRSPAPVFKSKWGAPQPPVTMHRDEDGSDASRSNTPLQSEISMSPHLTPFTPSMTNSPRHRRDGMLSPRKRADSTLTDLKLINQEADAHMEQLNREVNRGTFNPAYETELEQLKRQIFDLKLENRSLNDQLNKQGGPCPASEGEEHTASLELALQEAEVEVEQLSEELDRSRAAMSMLQAEIENLDGVARNDLLLEELVAERRAAGAHIVAHVLLTQQVHRRWRGFQAFQCAIRNEKTGQINQLKEAQEEALRVCKEAEEEAHKHSIANKGLWRQLGMERWQCSFIALSGLLKRTRDRKVAILLHQWSRGALKEIGSFKRLMELKDAARRREELLRREMERGMKEIARLIVIVRTLEGRVATENDPAIANVTQTAQGHVPAVGNSESSKMQMKKHAGGAQGGTGRRQLPGTARTRRPLTSRTPR